MLNNVDLMLIAYLLVAAVTIYFGIKISRPGYMRAFVFATLFSVFFSMGIFFGHGVGVFPGILLLGACILTDECSRIYGNTSAMLLYTLVPMLVQWAIILIVSFGLSYLAKRTGFDQSVPIVMSEKAIKHRRIIGAIWILLAIIVLLFSGKTLSSVVSIVLLVIVGFSLISNLSWSRWICLPFSVLALLNIPIGTAIGGYYLWYYFSIEKQA